MWAEPRNAKTMGRRTSEHCGVSRQCDKVRGDSDGDGDGDVAVVGNGNGNVKQR
jgi:hypothetical protein